MHFLVPIQRGETVILKASVNYVHRTSLEVGVRIEREDSIKGEREHAATAYLTFVAQDENGTPVPIEALAPKSDDEKRRFVEASERRKHRLARRQSLVNQRP